MFYGFVDFQAFHEKKKKFQILKYLHQQNRKKNRTESIVKRTKTKMLIKFIPQKQI